jgi:hypothetical protein
MANILGLVSDPEFQKMNSADQQATLASIDQDFGNLSSDDFGATVQALQKHALARGITPPQVQRPNPNMQPWGATVPGSKVPRSIQQSPDWVGDAIGGAAIAGLAAEPLSAVNPMTVAGPAVKYGVLPAAGYQGFKTLKELLGGQ